MDKVIIDAGKSLARQLIGGDVLVYKYDRDILKFEIMHVDDIQLKDKANIEVVDQAGKRRKIIEYTVINTNTEIFEAKSIILNEEHLKEVLKQIMISFHVSEKIEEYKKLTFLCSEQTDDEKKDLLFLKTEFSNYSFKDDTYQITQDIRSNLEINRRQPLEKNRLKLDVTTKFASRFYCKVNTDDLVNTIISYYSDDDDLRLINEPLDPNDEVKLNFRKLYTECSEKESGTNYNKFDGFKKEEI